MVRGNCVCVGGACPLTVRFRVYPIVCVRVFPTTAVVSLFLIWVRWTPWETRRRHGRR